MSASNKSEYRTPRKRNLKSIENLTNSDDSAADLDTARIGDMDENKAKPNTRRSTRRPSPTKKYQAYQMENQGKPQEEHIVVNYVEVSDDESENVDEEEEQEDSLVDAENAARPTSKDINLIQSEYNVAGTSMFGFNTPKKRDGMALAALNATPRTPKTPKTPRLGVKTPESKRTKSLDLPKTPAHVRTRIRKRK